MARAMPAPDCNICLANKGLEKTKVGRSEVLLCKSCRDYAAEHPSMSFYELNKGYWDKQPWPQGFMPGRVDRPEWHRQVYGAGRAK